MHGKEGAIVNGVREHGVARSGPQSAESADQIERTVVIMGLKYLLGPAFTGDDHDDAILPADLARWLTEQVGPVRAVHFRPPVQAWVEFVDVSDAKEALRSLTGAVYPKKSKAAPGGRIRVEMGTSRELIRGTKDHLVNTSSLIPERFLKQTRMLDPAAAIAPSEDPVVAAMKAANPYYEEDMLLYEAYHRRLADAEAASTRAEAEVFENRKRLFRGAATGDLDALEDAIWAGIDSDVPNPLDGGKTALHYAAAAGERTAVQVLIEHGANPSAVDDDGTTPLGVCESLGGGDEVPCGVKPSAVHRAIARDIEAAVAAHREMAALCGEIAAGRYDVNEVNGVRRVSGAGEVEGEDGVLPLHAAVEGRKGALTRFLLAQGASASAHSGPEGLTPLHVAARSGQLRMTRLLMLCGAPPNVAAKGPAGLGGTPLHEALRGVKANGTKGLHAKIAKLLIDDFKRLGLMAEAADIIKSTR